jgi:hypothetical protein
MKQFIGLIGSTDDFGLGLEEGMEVSDVMIDAFLEKEPWLVSYRFEVPDGLDELAIARIARGIFWENNWTQDDTVSVVMEDHGDIEEQQAERQEAHEADPQEGIEDETHEVDPEEEQDDDDLTFTATIR